MSYLSLILAALLLSLKASAYQSLRTILIFSLYLAVFEDSSLATVFGKDRVYERAAYPSVILILVHLIMMQVHFEFTADEMSISKDFFV